ncbi:mechanosensitive ion channel family protein [Halorubellus sp. JP-L1]|uniref:mechanosensitive ion channel family protein n=1 Tax=Halorubellus sp. JP-L1 TaxID=2715753 RepID=UPI001F038EFA|nr:mechanosensitive ion channel domain-containing protein [Halorubellus sp. JP-L1]
MQSETQPEPAPMDAEAVVREFLAGIVEAIPHVLLGVLFLAVAYVVIRVVLAVVRRVFEGVYPADQQLIVDLWVAIVGVFLWFGAALALFNIVGLGEVAASLGTASGFVGLGVAFALKEMIADTVAGVYLLRDPDFNEGDVVESASVTGEIVDIDLRKTRLREEDGDLVVLANRDVEKKWRQEVVGPESAKSEHVTGN